MLWRLYCFVVSHFLTRTLNFSKEIYQEKVIGLLKYIENGEKIVEKEIDELITLIEQPTSGT